MVGECNLPGGGHSQMGIICHILTPSRKIFAV